MEQLNIILGRRIDKPAVKILDWHTSNGLLIAGDSGRGKSNGLAFYLTQWSTLGARIVPCEYAGHIRSEDGLLAQTEHLSRAFLMPFTTEGDTILEYFEALKRINIERTQTDPSTHYPIVFCIDEFSSFLLTHGDKIPLKEFIATVITMRKSNIRFVLVGQRWAQLSQSGVAQLRGAFTSTALYGMSGDMASLFTQDTATRKLVQNLRPGYIFYNGTKLYVPRLTDQMREQARSMLDTLPCTETAMHCSPSQQLVEPLQNTQYSTAHSAQYDDLLALLLKLYPRVSKETIIRGFLTSGTKRRKLAEYFKIAGIGLDTNLVNRIAKEMKQNTAIDPIAIASIQ